MLNKLFKYNSVLTYLEKDDFYVSESNKHILKQIDNWPKWEKNFLNINGENYSGKTHLVNIFLNNL